MSAGIGILGDEGGGASIDAPGGGLTSSDRLLEMVYVELRALAAARLRRERRHTFQATELVHEAYMRLLGSGDPRWNGPGHFFASAAEAMRRVLIDRARKRMAAKHGGGVDAGPLRPECAPSRERPERLLALDQALIVFAEVEPEKAVLVNLRYFAGLSEEQASQAMGISRATASRHWAYARAWLYQEISRDRRHDRVG